MTFVRSLLGPLGSLLTTIALWLLGVPSDVTSTASQTFKDVVGMLPSRGSATPALDPSAREARVRALSDFGSSTLLAWQAAGSLATFRLNPVGLLHGVSFVMRAQKQFQDQMAVATGALSTLCLLTGTDVQERAVAVVEELSEQLHSLGRQRQGSDAASRTYDSGSSALGPKLSAWREAARAELVRE